MIEVKEPHGLRYTCCLLYTSVIRPLIYVPEKHIIHMRRELDLPVIKNPCPANGHTKRQEMKDLLSFLCKRYPNLKESMLSALKNRCV